MALPEEDRGPAWLRDWHTIEADVHAMDEFAKQLRTDVETNYVAHLTPVYDSMSTPLPAVSPDFPELVDLLETHQKATETTTTYVHDHANQSAHLAAAASQISENYRGSDAFAHATVNVVEKALGDAGANGPAPSGTDPAWSGGDQAVPGTEAY